MLTRRHLLTRSRCVLVLLVATSGTAALLRALVADVGSPVVTVDQALVRLCVVSLAAAAFWGWLATVSVVLEAWSGRPAHRTVAAPLRRWVLVCCGVALTAPVGAASGAEPQPPPTPMPELAGLPFPDRAVGPAHARPATSPGPRTVVVRAGDCLWHLAAEDLPDGATEADVTARWLAIHRLNAGVIGPDPDVIEPGQRLVLPSRPPADDTRR